MAKSARYDATQIKVLGGIEAVRKRPGMYIGDTSTRGMHHLVEEVVANSIDEAMAGHCTAIDVILGADGSVAVTDDGRGIPVDVHKEMKIPAVEVVMTTLHAGGKFDHDSYKVSGGLHGVGVSVVNALSEWLTVEVRRAGTVYFQEYERGAPVTPLEERGHTKKRGTKITFKPDTDIFGDVEFNYELIAARLRELAFLNNGVTIAISTEKGHQSETFSYRGGLKAFVQHLNREKDPLHKEVIHVTKVEAGVTLEVALQYTHAYSETVISFANNINTREGGTHLSGFRSALTRTFNAFARGMNGKLQKDAAALSGDDYKEGLTAVVSVKLPEPQFEGQTKTRLGNREIQGVVEAMINEQLGIYCEEHPGIVKAIISKAVEASRARQAARRARDLARRKGALNSGDLPGKLADCSSRDVDSTEIFLVEGVSAGGTAKLGRDRTFQAVLPLRGVVLNVEKASLDKVLANEEIRTLITAIGTGIGADEFDIAKLRYGKVIIMTDADVDGAHIRTLLLTFFFRQMPALITTGHVFIAQPPLYKIKHKRQEEYVYDDRDFEERMIHLGLEGLVVTPLIGRKKDRKALTPKALTSLVRICRRLARHEALLHRRGYLLSEFLMLRTDDGQLPRYAVDMPTATKYFYDDDSLQRFLERCEREQAGERGSPDGDERGADGDVERARVTEFHESRSLMHTIADMADLGFGPEHFSGGETPCLMVEAGGETHELEDLADFMPLIEQAGRKGVDVQRYKGLGEMNADELAETAMDPETRILRRVEVGNAQAADEIFIVLAGADVTRRRQYIEKHALEVSNLDI